MRPLDRDPLALTADEMRRTGHETVGLDALLARLAEGTVPDALGDGHPGFLGLTPTSPTWLGALRDLIASAGEVLARASLSHPRRPTIVARIPVRMPVLPERTLASATRPVPHLYREARAGFAARQRTR